MTDQVKQVATQAAQAVQTAVTAEVDKKVNTLANYLKDNAGKISMVVGVAAAAVVALAYHFL